MGKENPFRYRGDGCDGAAVLGCLRSREYDPERGRVLNAEGIIADGCGFNCGRMAWAVP